MSVGGAQASVLARQSVSTKTLRKRVRSALQVQLVAGTLLFLALSLQLWIRVVTIEKGYQLELIREAALKNDGRLRQKRLELAYAARPNELSKLATAGLGMEPLPPQRVRKVTQQ